MNREHTLRDIDDRLLRLGYGFIGLTIMIFVMMAFHGWYAASIVGALDRSTNAQLRIGSQLEQIKLRL